MKHIITDHTPLFVTGIGTNVGKTIVSAALVEYCKADYWKPVQAGDLHDSDSDKVIRLITNRISVIHPERFRLSMAQSPHRAAKHEGICIQPADFILPATKNKLIIEGAGGLFVPLSANFLMVDLIGQLAADVALVVRNYLGCINHTLMSIHALKSKGLPLKLLVFNGTFDLDTMEVIISHLPENTTWITMTEFLSPDKSSICSAFK